MTDRIRGCYVAFETDIRVDGAEEIMNAILLIRGVAAVDKSECVSSPETWISDKRVRRELGEKLWAVLYPPKDDK
jgi:hypothetical protein